jgi:homoserine dehydrogenase
MTRRERTQIEMNTLHIGMIGLGTVGAQVADRLLTRRTELRRRSGVDLLLERVLVRDVDRPRTVRVPAGLLTADPAAVVDDPCIDVVVEMAGGEEPMRSLLERAIRNGKHVVTANKLVVAEHGAELLELAREMDVGVRFEAAVGGGIPVVGTLEVDLLANDIRRILAVINGTTNYVLGRMADRDLSLAEALAEARDAGYAEADPTADVSGYDAACKLAILASLAFRTVVRPGQVHREGIERLETGDLRFARELGCEVKLVACASRHADGRLEARVHPALVPCGHPLAGVEGAANAICFEGDLAGTVVLRGQGAGGRPTASSVVRDILDIGGSTGRHRPMPDRDREVRMVPMDEIRTRACFRCRTADPTHALARIRAVFGAEGVGIASATRKPANEPFAEYVVATDEAPVAALTRTRERLTGLEPPAGVSVLLVTS